MLDEEPDDDESDDDDLEPDDDESDDDELLCEGACTVGCGALGASA